MNIQKTVRSDEHNTCRYAQLTGDWNPLHVDEEYTQRTETFGDGTIVHGAHVIGWFSALLNEIGAEIDAAVILVDLMTEFHNPLPVGSEATITVTIDDDDLPTDDEPRVISTVGLRAFDPESEMEYTTGSATLMLDQSVSRRENT